MVIGPTIVEITHTTDSILKALDQTVFHTTDSVLGERIPGLTVFHTTNSFIRCPPSFFVQEVDGTSTFLLEDGSGSLVANFICTFTVSHTTDSILKAIDQTVFHTTDSVLGERIPGISIFHTTSSYLIKRDIEITHTTDSILRTIDNELTHTTDSYFINRDIELTHTTDSFIIRRVLVVHTTSSFLRARTQEPDITVYVDDIIDQPIYINDIVDISILGG